MSELIQDRRVRIVMAASDIVAKLDESIRADAFRFLVRETDPAAALAAITTPPTRQGMTEITDFFKDRRGGNPATNAILMAGYLYSVYGAEAFTVDEVRNLAK